MSTKSAEPAPVELVPLGLVADELGMSRGEFEYRHAAEIVADDIGLRCVSAPFAKRIIAERNEAEAMQRESARKRDAEAEAKWRRPVGVPAGEGMSPVESMMANSDPPEWKNRVSPAQEFLDNIGKPPQ